MLLLLSSEELVHLVFALGLIFVPLFVDHHSFDLLPLTLILQLLSLLDLLLQLVVVLSQLWWCTFQLVLVAAAYGWRLRLLVIFVFFIVLMIDAIVELRIIVGLVLPVYLFDLGGELDHSLVNHQILYTVMVVKILVDVRAGRVERRKDNTLSRHVLHQRILRRVQRHVLRERVSRWIVLSLSLDVVTLHIVVGELLVDLLLLLVREHIN